MKRVERIYEKIKELGRSVSAEEISEILELDRSNVSRDLNQLVKEEKLVKGKGKPVLFDVNEDWTDKTGLEQFADQNTTLAPIVDKAVTAVLYPPNGMDMLILGETGVGKSMFAELIYEYTIETGEKTKDAPFIMFNCADYSNNPQLLLSQLFGTKKGAFTGASEDKPGLVDKADTGILFLDEVHHLPPEGQEMLVTFMDKGTYRKLGETDDVRKADVLLICATTTNPDVSLLKVFSRRIPMVMKIPSLEERSLEERSHLIHYFLNEESARLGHVIKVSVNSMRSILSYHCPNNIGQLKTDIQLACAKAYADFVTNKKSSIQINSIDLPEHIIHGLFNQVEHRKVWNRLRNVNERYFLFGQGEERSLFNTWDKHETIYNLIDSRLEEMQHSDMSGYEIEEEMDKDIEHYFARYIQDVDSAEGTTALDMIVPANVLAVVDKIIAHSERTLSYSFTQKIKYGMAVHIMNSIDRIRENQKIVNPKLHTIRVEHPKAFQVALECLTYIEETFDVSMPIDEAAFLTLFFVYDEEKITHSNDEVKIIVIAHGSTTATSMAETANRLLGIQHTVGINAPLDEKPQDVMDRLREVLKEFQGTSDILFLVDMGSLTTFGEEVEKELPIRSKTIPLVSTLHVIEATRKATMGYSIEEVYRDTLRVQSPLKSVETANKPIDSVDAPLAIATVCLTGEGTAVTMKRMLEKHLQFDSTLIHIINVNLVGKNSIYKQLDELKQRYSIIAVVSTLSFESTVPQFDLSQMLNGEAIPAIQSIIEVETTYKKMDITLDEHLEYVNGKEILADIKAFHSTITNTLAVSINTHTLIGIVFHISCMIDRLIIGSDVTRFPDKDTFIAENEQVYETVHDALTQIELKYNVKIPQDEVCYITNFFIKTPETEKR
ncbi:transcriptional regulatory protein LevR/transcriptional regulator with AAA-type ATPase domain [Salibacterium salarium]|uniref:sigma 54-interacting transcriptional regulator n=1 Tax=Salibacterium salarium TaxID=284579 RepID=UPI00278A4606|nr:sigma-54-dependent transcriptional regulator [Salibacterium salarium]MDQ0297917.1 transcriptional regulatory protein LevR/transcriptional regulator with AAA-type ATPase domain [Salibacterium salarium]